MLVTLTRPLAQLVLIVTYLQILFHWIHYETASLVVGRCTVVRVAIRRTVRSG